MKEWLISVLKNWLLRLDPDIFVVEDHIKDILLPSPNDEEKCQEEYWNSRWEQMPIIYNGRTLKRIDNSLLQSPVLQVPVDVRAFILSDDILIKQVLHNYDLIKDTWDDTMLAIQHFVVFGMRWNGVPFLEYTNDLDENESYEFWQFPFETISSNKGDCEDGAILIASLAINAGIPPWRIKVAAGYVSNRQYVQKFKLPEESISEGGHAYCIYLASDNEWRVIDWCYLNDANVPVLLKPLAKDGGYENSYKEVWFTFNNEHSWNQTALDIEVGRVKEITDKTELNPSTVEAYN